MTLDRIGLNTGAERLRKALQAAADRSQRAMARALRPHGLTLAQYDLLVLLEGMRCGCCGEGECRCDSSYLCQNDIGGRIDCTKGNVSGLVNRLAEDGLISREPDPRDRRYNAIRITAPGRAALLRAMPDVKAAEGGVFEPLDEAEAETLASLLERLGPDAPPRH